jgi:hypothetical protein
VQRSRQIVSQQPEKEESAIRMNFASLGEMLSQVSLRQQVRKEGYQTYVVGPQLHAQHALLGLEWQT